MGFKALSTVRSGATSAVSRQATVVNTSQGFAASGAAITGGTTINVEVVTPGQGTNVVPVSSGLTLSSVDYLYANGAVSPATAVSTAGGNIKINGTSFSDPMTIIVGSTALSNANVTVANSTAIIASLGSASPGNVSLFAFNSSNAGAQLSNAIRYSGVPEWTTSSISLINGSTSNVALVASSDSTLTYTLQAGSSLPTGMSLVSTGYISGTPTGYTNTTVLSPVIVATDTEGQATQQTITITIATSEPYFPYTTLLLNGETGTNAVNNATNNVFVDSSSNNFTVTRTGTTTQGSFSPFSQTGWSNYFSATNAYSTVSMGAAQAFGTGDFTVECWLYMAGTTAVNISMAATATTTWELLTYANQLYWHENGGNLGGTGYGAVPTNTWTHLAVSRASGVLKMFINGTQVYSAANTYNYSNTTTVRSIGPYNGGNAPYYLSNFRVIKGAGIYTSDFPTPTTPLTAVSGTQLLTCQSNRFIDNSSNNFTLTNTGAMSVQAFSPFSPSGGYSASTNGGSAYLDGSGNYLSLATNAAFNITSGSTDSFICEGWVYWTTVAANMSIFDNGGLNGVSFANWSITLNASSQLTLNWANSAAPGSTIGTLPTSIVPTTGQWYHIAFVKTNADWALFVNGTRATNFNGLNTAAKSSSTALYIGYGIATSAAGNAFKGYISNVRIYKGATASAPYSATSLTITVPTAPVTAITNTSLLTNFTNGGIVDAHSTTALQTAGDTKASTVVTKFGSTSIYFDGTGDYLTTQQLASPNYDLVACDFTVEGWFYNTGAGAERYIFSQRGASTGWELRINSGNTVQFFYTGGSSLTSIGTVTGNTWTHIAVTRSGTTVRIFINGNLDNSTTFSNGTSAAASYPLYIGNSTSGGGLFLGYMEDVRITRGFARYTANFPVPTTGFLGQ